ncbi:DNA-binding response regulator [Bdellovibrio sp. NC01]|nr:DNA-binding response regulator [Bdellovibrio sp. NC01]
MLLLDVNLPDRDGFEYCRELRSQRMFYDLPIIILTGQSQLDSKVHAFELGADDYITKPFEARELKARVLSKLRRSGKANETSFFAGGFRVDFSVQKIFSIADDEKETALNLTPIEFKLLSHFLQNEGKIFSRQELLDLFWADSMYVSKHTVDTHISSLRKKMGPAGASLRSIFKQGYRFAAGMGPKTKSHFDKQVDL